MLIDMKVAPTDYDPSFDVATGPPLTIYVGKGGGNVPFSAEWKEIQGYSRYPINFKVLPFGITVPAGWNGMVTLDGMGGFFGPIDGMTGISPAIKPGQTMSGLTMVSHGLPTIKNMEFAPDWMLNMGDKEPTADQEAQAAQVAESLAFHVSVLAPSWTVAGSLAHWDQFQKDVATAVSLGWIPDATLAQTIQNQLQTARNDMSTEGPSANTIAATNALIATVSSATPGQLTADGQTLLTQNLNALTRYFVNLPSSVPPPPPNVPKVSILNPPGPGYLMTAPVGSSVTITAQVVDLTNNNTPLQDFVVPITVVSGPNAGVATSAPTDDNGNASLTYTGTALGQDTINVTVQGPVPPQALAAPRFIHAVYTTGQTALARVSAIKVALATSPTPAVATVIWQGGPDLIITGFTPPMIESDGQRPIHITDITENIGDTAVGPSTTRYYLSTTTPVDPKTAVLVGQRPVPALTPGQSDSYQTDVPFPAGYGGPRTYYLTACANGDRAVVETNYDNNCEVRQIAVPLKQANPPPDCSKAEASPALLWPPDHKLATISITGVDDPDGEQVTIKVTKITQDEPVNGLGDGDTSPDGFGLGQPQAKVRAERSGLGNGRVYATSFTASDLAGGTCNATVNVGVPHDQNQGSTPIDDGQKYESTLP